MIKDLQEVIDRQISYELNPWRDVGVVFDGTKVVSVPPQLSYMSEGMSVLKKNLEPDFMTQSHLIWPTVLSLYAVPKEIFKHKTQSEKHDICVWIGLRSHSGKQEPGYQGTATFRVLSQKFPEEVFKVLELTSFSGNEETANRSRDYQWEEYVPKDGCESHHWGTENMVEKLKQNVDIALALRQYQKTKAPLVNTP
jgi:hypothetical protein